VTGNTVVFRRRSNTPGCAELLVKDYEEPACPRGRSFVSAVAARGDEFVNNKTIRAVSFTGSCEVGGEVAKQAAGISPRSPARWAARTAGVMDDAGILTLRSKAAPRARSARRGNAGTATKSGDFAQGDRRQVSQKLIERVKKIKVGDGMEDGTTWPAVDKAQFRDRSAYMEMRRRKAASV